MRRMISRSSALSLAVAAGVLALAACSDTVTTPPAARQAGAPSLTIGPTANVGAVHVTFISNGSTQFCSGATVVHGYAIPGTFAPLAGCGTAFDIQNNLTNTPQNPNAYNPGWSSPIIGSDWIGPNALSNEYRTAPGTYVFQTQFTVPSGVTNPILNDTLLSDNAVAVYLNGHLVEQQLIQDCPDANKTATPPTCNWNKAFIISDANAADFNVNGVVNGNTITVLLVDTPNGGNAGNSFACTATFQANGEVGFGTPFTNPTSPNHVLAGWTTTMTSTTGCENPTGLDFSGSVSWVVPPPPVIPLFVIGDDQPHDIGDIVNFWGAQWWKNNPTSLTDDSGWESFKGFALNRDNFCGGVWSTDPGNSAPPPPPPLAAQIGIIVTDVVHKNGNVLSGNIKEIILVNQDGNYSNNPGHAGNGTVASVVCP